MGIADIPLADRFFRPLIIGGEMVGSGMDVLFSGLLRNASDIEEVVLFPSSSMLNMPLFMLTGDLWPLLRDDRGRRLSEVGLFE